MSKAVIKKQIRFWENRINPITGWVENKRDEDSKMVHRIELNRKRSYEKFEALAKKGALL